MQTIFTAFRFALLMMILGGLVCPLTVTGLGQLLFPQQANGSLIKSQNGRIIGSNLIGQNFTRQEYFHPRPSVNSYDAANSGGSNLAATSKKLIGQVAQNATAYQKTNQWDKAVPIDAVTVSASNVDPHISLANALAQAPRIAATRKVELKVIENLVREMTENTLAETLYVNVLQLNLALDNQPLKSK